MTAGAPGAAQAATPRTTSAARPVTVLGTRRALAALAPLRDAYTRTATVICVALAAALPPPTDLAHLAADADAVLLVGPRRRSPRTVLPGPALTAPGGRRVPAAWLPDVGTGPLSRFAVTAARIHARPPAPAGPTVALLAQRSRRYRDLSARIERLLTDGAVTRVRWTADEVVRDDLARGLACGPACALYVGHGRPVGWVGYRGVRAHHLDGMAEPPAVVLSLTCLTASRRRVGLSFAEALPLQGSAAAVLAATSPTRHLWNARWALRVTGALAAGAASVGEVVATTQPLGDAARSYRLIGDPLAPLADAPGAADRAAAHTAAVTFPPLPIAAAGLGATA